VNRETGSSIGIFLDNYSYQQWEFSENSQNVKIKIEKYTILYIIGLCNKVDRCVFMLLMAKLLHKL
jgi:hypothetical protein